MNGLFVSKFECDPSLIQIIRLVQDDIADRIQTIREEAIDYPADHVIDILQNIQSISAGEVSHVEV